jgi:hypothetical protein
VALLDALRALTSFDPPAELPRSIRNSPRSSPQFPLEARGEI